MPQQNKIDELESVLEELMHSLPLVQAHGLCLLKKDPTKVVQLIAEELNQLEIWLSIERDFGAMGSTLFTEKSYYVLEIASVAAKKGNFHLSATIYSLLVKLAANYSLMTNQVDVEVENLSTDVFNSLREWSVALIPKDEFEPTIQILRTTTVYKSIVDSGLNIPFTDAISHLQ